MANSEHLNVVLQGSGAIEDWRRKQPDVAFDLSNADLSGVNLQNANLRGANLSGADLSNAQILFADFSFAQLEGTNLKHVVASVFPPLAMTVGSTRFIHADLSSADLRSATLFDVDFREANLSGADLREAHLEWTDFSWATLKNANFSGTRLGFNVFVGCDLSLCEGLEHQAWAQAALQCRDPCVTHAGRVDLCVGRQVQAVAAPL
jgi:uncharacterized protein YjbI with pentapeptide repeats